MTVRALVVAAVFVAACAGGASRPAVPSASPARQPSAVAPATPAARATEAPRQTPAPASGISPGFAPTGPTQDAKVVEVTDGDTIRVRFDGAVHPVRYIGIDTPETGGPFVSVEPFGREAAGANRRLVDDERVLLEIDVSERDQYDRLLRHVWVSEGGRWLLVSAELLQRGLASVTTYPPDVKYVDLFLDAQQEAQDAGLGIWGDTPAAELPPKPNSDPLPVFGGDCDPSYPDVCIAPSPPDLDCSQISFRRFTVLSPDPHRFDGDFDGIGCESS